MAGTPARQFTQNAPERHYKSAKAPKVSTSNAANEKVGGVVHRTAPADAAAVARKTTGISYVAMKPMKVGGVKKNPGDLIPEAAGWRNVHNYISSGYLAVVGS